ncbi:MAG: SBBP repeat-containing protein [Chitinophagaceae bacterium]|nr:SBBP repeat-containing protein [Chitinophagaceae bacterium]
MKKHLLFVLILVCTQILHAQTPQFHWAFDLQAYTVNGMAIDSNDNVYVTGSFDDTTDFDPSAAVYKLTPIAGNDVFVAKYNKLGALVWVVSFGSTDHDYAYDIKIDKNNSLVVTGDFWGSLSFDSAGTKKYCYDNGNRDVFVLKLDLNGKYIFCKNLGGLYRDEARALAIDKQGNIYTTGTFYVQMDFDPSPSKVVYKPTTFSTVTAECVFISKLDSNGNYVWGKYFATKRYCRSYAIDVDKYENVYLCGASVDSIDLNPDGGGYTPSPTSATAHYITKLNKNGSFAWAKQVEGYRTFTACPSSVKVDDTGNVYMQIWGSQYSSIGATTLPPGMAFITGLNLIKFDSAGAFKYLRGIGRGGAGPIGHLKYNSGTKFTFDSQNNIVSAFLIGAKADVDPSDDSVFLYSKSTFSIAVTKIDQSGKLLWAYNFADTITNGPSALALSNRDNIYLSGVFNYKIDYDPSSDTSFSKSSNGGTFVHKMSSCQVKSNLSIAACNSFTLGAYTYSESGSYKPIFIAKNSCDSIVALNLSITHTNDSVVKTGSTLTALATSVSYQWVRCPSYAAIVGATSNTYTPSTTGNYAVIIKDGICTDTSACINTWGLGIPDENHSPQQIAISPNPSTGLCTIHTGIAAKDMQLMLYNNMGTLVLSQKTQSASSTINIANLPSGVYFIKVFSDKQNLGVQKLVKH